MTELSIEVSDLQPCPTCAAVVRKQDMDEHQRWHVSSTADTSTSSPDTGTTGTTGSSASIASDTGERPAGG